MHRCPCCEYNTLDEPGQYEICPVCFWEDDPFQCDNPNYGGGANRPSLNQAKINYAEFGAYERRVLRFVRKPLPDEM